MRIRPNLSTPLLLLALAACSDDSRGGAEPSPTGPLAAAAPAREVPPRSEQRPGTWIDRSDDELWSRIESGGGQVAVGLKAPGARRGVYRGEILLERSQWVQARNAVLAQRGVETVRVDDLLPVVEVRLADRSALRAVRRLPMVDYVEPVYDPTDPEPFAGVGGCGWGSAWGDDRQYTGSGDVYSARFTAMNIPAAWSLSSGAGVTVGVTDTGISSGQRQFFERFATGESAGRTIRLLRVSSMSDPYDRCGHGTRMSGVVAAPRDGVGAGGVAYGANLVSVRQADGVAAVSSSDAKYSVRTAVQNGSRIVVMGWESLNWWWQVSDEIEYWHYRRPVLFLGAAGTSGCGDLIWDNNVVFPADMPEVVAVTGVRYPDGAIPCGIHYGREVELTAYTDVPTTGRYTEDLVGIGGSSNAVAVVSGIAALTWSRTPTLTRDQLRQRLQRSGALYPNRSSTRGYGLVDAYRAVSGQ